MRKIGILLLTLCLAAVLSFAQTDKKATTSKGSSSKAATKSDMSKSDMSKSDTAKTTTGKTAPAGKMDINSASASDLEKLPGIGPATSAKIVAGRPYKTKRDLLTKKIVSQSEYDKISDNIIAHQDTSMAADKSEKKATTTKKK